MGILNVTPDSFSDGGRYLDPSRALARALEMQAQGADIIDVGGESTRPRAAVSVTEAEEIARVRPVLERLGAKLRVPISIDTRRSRVAQIALDCGAAIVNDISALRDDPALAAVAARARCAVVLMHMRGGATDHIRHARYVDVVGEVADFLRGRARFAQAAGIARSRIIVDPGIGFAKLASHNLRLLACLPRIAALGYPVLVGVSRKTFIRRLAGAGEREVAFASAAIDAMAVAAGASIVRTHDPAASRAAIAMARAIAASDAR
jgi:dihydropteroate synthase